MQTRFAIAMAVIGAICGGLNYLTHYITWKDGEFGTENARLWMLGVVNVLYAMFLISVACWIVCVLEG